MISTLSKFVYLKFMIYPSGNGGFFFSNDTACDSTYSAFCLHSRSQLCVFCLYDVNYYAVYLLSMSTIHRVCRLLHEYIII